MSSTLSVVKPFFKYSLNKRSLTPFIKSLKVRKHVPTYQAEIKKICGKMIYIINWAAASLSAFCLF